jgi:hypothetical protein
MDAKGIALGSLGAMAQDLLYVLLFQEFRIQSKNIHCLKKSNHRKNNFLSSPIKVD